MKAIVELIERHPEYYLKIDIQKLSSDELIYWCPEELIKGVAAEIKGEKYKIPENNYCPCGHWFFWILTKDGSCGIVSGLAMNAWYLRNLYEGNIKPGEQKSTKKVHEAMKKYLTTVMLTPSPK